MLSNADNEQNLILFIHMKNRIPLWVLYQHLSIRIRRNLLNRLPCV